MFETYRNILLTKTKKWEQEDEMRFIGTRQNVNLILDGRISEVTFGPNVPPAILAKLTAEIANHCRAKNTHVSQLSLEGAKTA
jgi:hypothetical protein